MLLPGTHAYRIVVDGHEMLDEFNNLRDETVGANVVVVPGARDEAGAVRGGDAGRAFEGRTP